MKSTPVKLKTQRNAHVNAEGLGYAAPVGIMSHISVQQPQLRRSARLLAKQSILSDSKEVSSEYFLKGIATTGEVSRYSN